MIQKITKLFFHYDVVQRKARVFTIQSHRIADLTPEVIENCDGIPIKNRRQY